MQIELTLNVYWNLFISDNEWYNLACYYTINLLYLFYASIYFFIPNVIACFYDGVSFTTVTCNHYTWTLHLPVPVKYVNCVAVYVYNILNL